jgi:hypothetical protein
MRLCLTFAGPAQTLGAFQLGRGIAAHQAIGPSGAAGTDRRHRRCQRRMGPPGARLPPRASSRSDGGRAAVRLRQSCLACDRYESADTIEQIVRQPHVTTIDFRARRAGASRSGAHRRPSHVHEGALFVLFEIGLAQAATLG